MINVLILLCCFYFQNDQNFYIKNYSQDRIINLVCCVWFLLVFFLLYPEQNLFFSLSVRFNKFSIVLSSNVNTVHIYVIFCILIII